MHDLLKDEEPRDIANTLSMVLETRNLILGVKVLAVSYLVHYDNSLQNLRDIITKWTSILLQDATKVIRKCVSHFIKNATVLLQFDDSITI